MTTRRDKQFYLDMIAGNGSACTYNAAIVARATGRDQRRLLRRHGDAIAAATFRRLLLK